MLESVKLIRFAKEIFNLEVGNMTDVQAMRESIFVDGREQGKVEGRAEGEVKGHNDALAVLQDMNLSPEQIAEFKAKLEARSAQR